VPGSKEGTKYEVEFISGEGGAVCTCPAFKFSRTKQGCKHISDVFNNGCFYHPQWNEKGGKKTIRPKDHAFAPAGFSETEKCPGCDGPTMLVRVAV